MTAPLLTLGAGDSIDGGAGNDTLNAEINAAVGNTTTIKNVETVNVTTYGANSVDMTNITGVTAFNSVNSVAALTLNNIADATMALGLKGSVTNSITANYASGALAGTADTATINLNGATAAAIDVDAGFESAKVNVTGSNSLATLTAPGVTTLTLAGDGNLTIDTSGTTDGSSNLATAYGNVIATSMTGALTGKDNDADGFAGEGFTTATTGSSYLLGSGNDNIFVKDAATGTASNYISAGAGDDKVGFTVGATSSTVSNLVSGGAGNDSVLVTTAAGSATGSEDVFDLGEGSADSLTIAGAGVNTWTLKGVETVTLLKTATAANTFSGADSALAITAQVNGSAVDVEGLSSGSTVAINSASDATTKTATTVTVKFAATEATNTININSGMAGSSALALDKITAATVNLGAASTLSTVSTNSAATDLTINATGALVTTTIGASDTKLAKLTVTGSDAVTTTTLGASGVLTDVNVTAAKNLEVTTIGASGTKLTNVNLTATAGTLKADAIGTTTGTNTLAVNLTASGNISGKTTAASSLAIDSTKLGNVAASSSGGTVQLGTIGASATTIGNVTVSGKSDVTVGAIGTTAATSVGNISISSNDGFLKLTAAPVDTADTGGISVSLSAKTYIDSTGAGGAAVVKNTGGDITATLAGAAAAVVNYTNTTSGLTNLTASNTGGLTSTITNAGTAGSAQTSAVVLGNAASGKTNAITMDGTVDTINITGGTGKDTVAFGGSDAIKNGTIALGAGTDDSVDFSGLAITNSKGLAMNFSSSTVTFGSGYANSTTLASGKVAAYDAANYDGSSTAANTAIVASGQNFTVSGVESVVGTGVADYIAVSNTGMSVTGGAGADKIVLNAGVDTVVFGAGSLTGITMGANTTAVADTITDFSTSDVLNISITNGQTGLLIANANNGAVAAGAAVVEHVGTAATTLGATTNVIVFDTAVASSAALLTAIGTTAGTKLTEATVLTANSDLVIVWTDGTNSHIGLISDANGDTAAVMLAADLTYSEVATLSGVTSVSALTASNFAFIA